MTSRSRRRVHRDWAYLDNILLGRTLHLHALSPLHLPDDDDEQGTYDTERRLTNDDLDRFAQHLSNFLRVRLTGIAVDPASEKVDRRTRSQTIGESCIRHVRASFISVPRPRDDDNENNDDYDGDGIDLHDVPPPWAVEIEVRPPAATNVQTDPFGNAPQTQQRKRHEFAHLLFLSSPAHVTPTHYPFLVWKAPPTSSFPRTSGLTPFVAGNDEIDAARAMSESDASSGSPPMSARLLMAHTLDFVSRYFDCRQSQQAPLSSVRGAKLASVAEAVFQQHRSDMSSRNELLLRADQCAVDVGYALPSSLQNDELRIEANKESFDLTPGPAPELNLISLNVPSALVKELMHSTPLDTPILPAIEHYLAAHTSLQLNRLTLVRVGIANVYIGTPTTTTLTLRAGQSTAEVRMKFTAITSNGGRSRKRRETFHTSLVEVRRIANVLYQLVSLAQTDEW